MSASVLVARSRHLLGPYEVTGEIGAGGMGQVYGATDTRLGRDGAIKALPAAGRRARSRALVVLQARGAGPS